MNLDCCDHTRNNIALSQPQGGDHREDSLGETGAFAVLVAFVAWPSPGDRPLLAPRPKLNDYWLVIAVVLITG